MCGKDTHSQVLKTYGQNLFLTASQNKIEVHRIKRCPLLGEFEKLSIMEEEDTAEVS